MTSPVENPAMAAAKIAWVPVSSSASRRSWGKPLLPREADGTAEVPLQRRQIGDIDRRPIEADQPAPPVPCARRSRFGQRPGDPAEQFAQRGFAQAHPGLGDGRLARQSQGRPVPAQPAQTLDQFPQHGVIRGVGIERQSHHVIDDDARQQLTRAPILSPGVPQNRIHQIDRHNPRQNPQRHMLTKPMALNKTGTLLAHRRSLPHPSTSSTAPSTNHPLFQHVQTQHIMKNATERYCALAAQLTTKK